MSKFAPMEYLSKQRYDEIAAELNHLINVVYPEVRENVAETGSQGDRSENRRKNGERCCRKLKQQKVFLFFIKF